jgi:ribonuclease R
MSYPKKMSGIVKRHPDGFGFFIPDESSHPDAYIPFHFMNGVMTHDKVEALISEDGRKNRYWGKILSIQKRYWSQIVAPIEKHGSKYYIKDAEGAWGQNILVTVPKEFKNIQDQDLVAVTITDYSESQKGLSATLIKKLGSIEQAQFDVERVARTQGIPFEFSQAVLKQSQKFPLEVSKKDLQGRKNLQDLNFITIDGATAQDFDDAIFVQRKKSGWTLFVAIADVSYYVEPNSPIDQEAFERGTSSYFPNFVIPMLPEILSNNLCSLRPNVTRLAFVCEMNLSQDGHLNGYQFYEASICSKARVTYGQAQEILDGISIPGLEHVEEDIKAAYPLAQLLLDKRLDEGSLDLEMPEIQVIVNTLGDPIDIIKTRRLFAHRMIEEFMLMTNIATARFFEEHQLSGIYRVHENPKPEALKQLSDFAKSLGLSIKPQSPFLQKEIRQAISRLSHSAQSDSFSNLVLRSMKQAKYSAENTGHFGLCFTHYSHFTSPIRRYPDLIAHRVIKSYLKRKSRTSEQKTQGQLNQEEMQSACTWLSSTEQRAVKAERLIVSIKKARFIQKHLGETHIGTVSSVTKFGVFVTLRQFEVEGLVHVENLSRNPQSRWEFDESHFTLTELRSGRKYSLGDELSVTLVQANIMDGKIDFILSSSSPSLSVSSSLSPSTSKTLLQYQSERSSQRTSGNNSPSRSKDKKREKDRSSGKDRDTGKNQNQDQSKETRKNSEKNSEKYSKKHTEKYSKKGSEKSSGNSSQRSSKKSSERSYKKNTGSFSEKYSESSSESSPEKITPDSALPKKESSWRFNPGRKLMEILSRKGLKPSREFIRQELEETTTTKKNPHAKLSLKPQRKPSSKTQNSLKTKSKSNNNNSNGNSSGKGNGHSKAKAKGQSQPRSEKGPYKKRRSSSS